mmetsp:Transcript_48567/g.113364  ORF Transcript_48567/g.113364 Transcript_48567/m.113364 type:complete len:704 (+) Transcript_48567:81-2192(+)
MAEKLFQKPKVYDPSMADKSMLPPPNSRMQQMLDLGFDDAAHLHPEMEEKCGQLTEQLESAQQQLKEVQAEVRRAKDEEAKMALKLQSFQQVNRSQTALVRGELQKTRKKLAHMQSVAQRLKDQAAWFQTKSPNLSLPGELAHMPTEEEAVEEHAELAQLHERWEKDVAQLAADLAGKPRASSGPEDLHEARSRIEQLEQLAKKQKKQMEQQGKELEYFKGGAQASPSSSDTLSTSGSVSEEVVSLRKDLEAAEEKTKEQVKKLKQLATAYKKLDSEKGELEAKLRTCETSPKAGRALSSEVVAKVQAAVAAGKKQVSEMRASVAAEIQQQLPQVLEEVMRSKASDLQKLLDAGAQEWKEKYSVECERRRKLHNLVQELKGNIRVYCRVRPMTEAEASHGCCISFPGPDEIQISNADMGQKKTFQFNEIYRQNASQADLFSGIRDLVVSMLDGYNVCMFAYGQTGSGKTHSMQGTKDNPGVYTRTFKELFNVARERTGWKIELKGACVEIYNEELRDLLLGPNDKKQKLQVRQGKDGNYVPGLTTLPVNTVEEVEMLLSTAQTNRTVAATDMNLHSSRSHLAVQILGTMTNPDGKQLSSAITLVDLAGSERLAKSGVAGDRAKEAIAINKSLSSLGDVIAARAQKNAHTPYRNSVLTHFLQDSLGGDSKTLMLLQLNPCGSHVEESMCSLNFGARVNAVEMKK